MASKRRRQIKFGSNLFKGLRFQKAEPFVGFKGKALNKNKIVI